MRTGIGFSPMQGQSVPRAPAERPGGAGAIGVRPGVQRDWLDIVFLFSLLGAFPATLLMPNDIFSSIFDKIHKIGGGREYVWIIGPVAAYVYVLFKLVKLLRGKPVPQDPDSDEMDAMAPDGAVECVHQPRRNWIMIALWFSFLVVWSLGLLLLAGMLVFLVIEGLNAYLPFAFFLGTGFAAAWIMILLEFKSCWRGEIVPTDDVPPWPKHL